MKPDQNELHQLASSLHSVSIHLLRHARRADREFGLSSEKLSLLSVLTFAGPQRVSTLADIEMISKPAISRNLKSLEQLGLASRNRSQDDQREVIATASSKGKVLIKKAQQLRYQRLTTLLKKMNRQSLDQLNNSMLALQKLL